MEEGLRLLMWRFILDGRFADFEVEGDDFIHSARAVTCFVLISSISSSFWLLTV